MNIKIIPAIDLIEGKCVRLSQGDYNKCTTYGNSPLDIAKQYEDCGIERLHLVDLDGAKASKPQNLATLERIASHTSLTIEYGGGIKERESVVSVFDAGANMAICGSVACNEPDTFIGWLGEFGKEKLIFGADLKNGIPAVRGWLEEGKISIGTLLQRFTEAGLTSSIITDIACDGMLQGPSINLYKSIREKFPQLDIIASGGVSCIDDILELEKENIFGVVVGKAIYEGRITLKDLTRLNS